MSTVYRVARDEEYPELYDKFDMTVRLTWPVLIAIRDGEIIGMLGTHGDERLTAGPLEIKMPDGLTHHFVMYRLIRIYEELMKAMDMKKFYFYVEKGYNGHFIAQVERVGIYNKLWETENFVWYEKIL